MAKLKGGLFPIRGKIDGKVFVHVPGGGSYVRDAVEPGTKKDEPALKQHYVRTPFLNKLAAGISNILKFESDGNWHGGFYSRRACTNDRAESRSALVEWLSDRHLLPSMADIDFSTPLEVVSTPSTPDASVGTSSARG